MKISPVQIYIIWTSILVGIVRLITYFGFHKDIGIIAPILIVLFFQIAILFPFVSIIKIVQDENS
jgi:hypothetical protein